MTALEIDARQVLDLVVAARNVIDHGRSVNDASERPPYYKVEMADARQLKAALDALTP